MKSTVYPDHPAPVLALRTVTYCTENEETQTSATSRRLRVRSRASSIVPGSRRCLLPRPRSVR